MYVFLGVQKKRFSIEQIDSTPAAWECRETCVKTWFSTPFHQTENVGGLWGGLKAANIMKLIKLNNN